MEIKVISTSNPHTLLKLWKSFAAHPGNKRKLKTIRREIKLWKQRIRDLEASDRIHAHALGVSLD
jgi:hypothetical protein